MIRVFTLMLVSYSLSSGFLIQSGAQSISTAGDLKSRAQSLLARGQLAEAELTLTQAEKLAPADPEILTLEAKVKGRLGDPDAAILLFQRVIQLMPKSGEAHVNLAIVLADSGDLRGALAQTSKAIALAPNLPVAHLNRARILEDMKMDQEAIAEFALASRLDPKNPDCYFYWSFADRATGDLAGETKLLQRVVDLQPRNEKAELMLADSLLDQDRESEAVAVLRNALQIDADSAQATYVLSRALLKTDPAESKRLLEQFDRLKQQSAVVDQAKELANEAYQAFTAQDWRKAVRIFREALETCGDCEIQGALHRDLGLAMCRDGEIDPCVVELRKALALNPEDRDAAKALELVDIRER
jgi:tetratricopeptide (TPR) repeat protein